MDIPRFNMEPKTAVSLAAGAVLGGIALYRAYRDQGMEKPEEQAQHAAGLDEPIGGVHHVAAESRIYQKRRSHRKQLADSGRGDSLVDTLADTLADNLTDNLTDPLADSLSG